MRVRFIEWYTQSVKEFFILCIRIPFLMTRIMDNKSLMLGDWVQHRDGTPYQIAEIGGMVCIDAEQELFASLEDIQPIPLTAEILEKNEFDIINVKYGQRIYVIADDYYELEVDEMTESIWRVNYWNLESSSFDASLHIAFVHELQHALRLLGIEKEIVL